MDAHHLYFFLPLVIVCTFGGWLSYIDFKIHRLPNAIVATMTLLIALCLGFVQEPTKHLYFAIGYFVIFLLLFFASRQQLGMGDVKFAVPLGLATSFYSLRLDLLIFNTFMAAGVITSVLLISRRISLQSQIAFGPVMTIGAIFTIITAI